MITTEQIQLLPLGKMVYVIDIDGDNPKIERGFIEEKYDIFNNVHFRNISVQTSHMKYSLDVKGSDSEFRRATAFLDRGEARDALICFLVKKIEELTKCLNSFMNDERWLEKNKDKMKEI